MTRATARDFGSAPLLTSRRISGVVEPEQIELERQLIGDRRRTHPGGSSRAPSTAGRSADSRYIVGRMIAERESAELATKLFERTMARQSIDRVQRRIHADRGRADEIVSVSLRWRPSVRTRFVFTARVAGDA